MEQLSVAAGFILTLPIAETFTGQSMPHLRPSWIGATSRNVTPRRFRKWRHFASSAGIAAGSSTGTSKRG